VTDPGLEAFWRQTGGDRTVHDMVLRVVMDASGRVKSVDFNQRF